MKRLAQLGVFLLVTALFTAPAGATGEATAGGYATGTFEFTSWVETELTALPEGGKLIHLAATENFHGDITGTASAEEEHFVRADGTREFAGIIVVKGKLAGRQGGIIVRTTGTFDGKVARSDWRVVSASGGLRGLRGIGTDTAGGTTTTYTLAYWFGRAY